MLGKTLLSVVVLLFASNQLASATNFLTIGQCNGSGFETMKSSDCSDSENASSTTNYCYEDKVIYGFTEDTKTTQNACTFKKTLKDKVNILKIDKAIVEDNDLSALDTDLDKIVIYDCQTGETNCQRMTGIARKGSTDTYYFVGTETDTVGEAFDMGSTKEYLVYEADGAKYYHYDSTSEKYIKYTNPGFGDNVCVDENSVIYERKDALCDVGGAVCQYYYNCDNGSCSLTRLNTRDETTHQEPLCQPSQGNDNCDNGYQIESQKLYLCDEAGCTPQPNDIGYFAKGLESGPSIYCEVDNTDPSNPTQKCTTPTITSDNCDTSIGGLRNNGDGYHICLGEAGAGNALSGFNNKQVVLKIDTTSGLYGIKPNSLTSDDTDKTVQYFLAVEVSGGKNVKVVKETTPIRYKYEDTTTSIFYQGNGYGKDVCTNTNKEYKLVQWNDDLDIDYADLYIINEA